jgi:hypothetical protein
MSHQLETGMMLARDSERPEDDRVFLRSIVTAPWWAFWRARVRTLVMATGQARTVAAGLNDAVHRLEVKRNSKRRIVTLDER